MSDADTPQFRVSNEGEPIPPVDPEELKRRWSIRNQRLTCEVRRAEQGQESDSVAIAHRLRMVSMLAESFNHGQLLAPWKRGEELDDAVFRLAATFPIRPLLQHVYKVAGDSLSGFDPNAFVEKLVEETGISHTWEPVLARIPEGSLSFSYVTCRATFTGQGSSDREAAKEALMKKRMAGETSEREVKQEARELLWAVWSKCQPSLSRPSHKHELELMTLTMHFIDFVIDNIDLAREFVTSGHPLTTLLQLELNATWLDLECSVCQRLMREHSDNEMTRCSQALPLGTTPYRFRTS